MPAEELVFEPTPAFGEYKPFLEHATAHPAKMNTKLIEFLVESWTKPGETVLDPMAGTGSLGVIAALHGRNAVQVELEKKFYDWMEKARLNMEKHPMLTPKGKIVNICGDARHLSELLKGVGSEPTAVITSPPYSEGIGHDSGDNASELYKERLEMQRRYTRQMVSGGNIGNFPHGSIDAVLTSPPYSESMTKKRKGYTIIPELAKIREMPQDTRNDNIANLPHGSIDLVLTSPPYADIERRDRSRESWFNEDKEREKAGGAVTIQKGYRGNSENIGNLPLGNVDTIITSPPYVESVNAPNDPEKRAQRILQAGLDPKKIVGGKARCGQVNWQYGQSEGQIGNLPLGEISTIITSPPYGEAQEGSGIAKRGYQSGKHSPTDLVGKRSYMPDKFESPENISKLPYVDAVITSPPYETSVSDNKESPLVGADENKYGRWKKGTAKKHSYTQHGEPCKVDIVITSPPYADGKKAGEVKPEEVEKYAERWEENVEKRNWNSWGKSFHTPGRLMGIKSLRDGYSNSKENIGNLPLGDIDCCITSPPYEGSLEGTTRHTRGGIASRDPALAQSGSYATVMSFGVPVGCSPSKDNIGNLKSSDEEYKALFDAVLTSPPYANESTSSKPTNLEKQGLFKMGHSREEPYTEEDYREWDKHKGGNIGKRKLFVRVPCNPEEAQFHDTRPGRKGTIWEWTKEVEATSEVVEQIQKLKSERKGKSETYLEAMFKVYSEMFRVLKPNGKAIVVVKPFIRNKKVVDLPWHTWLLMQRVGFQLAKLYKLRLKQESFWRILYYKKHPEVPRLRHEYVLVCRKPTDGEQSEASSAPQVNSIEFLAESLRRERVNKTLSAFLRSLRVGCRPA